MKKAPKIYHEIRPWGNFFRYTNNTVSTVKVITVNPEEALSYQFHRNRDELWVPLTKNLGVTIGEQTFTASQNDPIFISRLTKHRAFAVGKKPAQWLEIAFGDFDEEDVVRLEDRYGRA